MTTTRSARRAAVLGSAAALVAAGAGATTVVVGGGPANAVDLPVTTCTDTGPGSLRQAILDAESAPGADTIVITALCTGADAVPVGSAMTITESLTITGPGADAFVLDGGGASNILDVTGDGTTDFSLSGVTITHSSAPVPAVTVSQFDALTVTGVDFVDNEATVDEGGALSAGYSSGAVTITASNFVGNRADGPSGGGAGFFGLALGGTIRITDSLFADNEAYRGAGVMTSSSTGTLLVANSTFTGNDVVSSGALYAELTGAATILFTTVTDNTTENTTGGFYFLPAGGAITIVGSIFSGNTGLQVSSGGRTVTSSDNDFHGPVGGFTPDASDLDVDPQLGPLADNGGPTHTRALAATSPVLNLGPVTVPDFPGNGSDQRGAPYLREYGGRSDMGAYELQPDPLPPTPGPGPVPEPTFTG